MQAGRITNLKRQNTILVNNDRMRRAGIVNGINVGEIAQI